MRGYRHIVSRVLLVALTFWALAMVVPDFYRVYQPLGSFGFYANNDGIITDVQGPFLEQTASPAFQAGLRVGDRLDLTQMRCIPIRTVRCASAMAALGGFRLVANRQRADLVIAAAPGRPAREVDIIASQRPYNGWVLAVLLLDQVAAMLVILAAAWLVWTRPGIMTWGFFLYVIWFNPGQSAQYYALLQQYSPIALLTQNVVGAIAQGIGSAGFIWFALRAPNDETTSRWRPVELILPYIAIVLAGLLALSYANLRLSDRDGHQGWCIEWNCRRCMCFPNTFGPPKGAPAARLSTPSLGDLGVSDRIARTCVRGRRYNHDTSK